MEIKAGQRYKHWKGNIYTIVALAKNSETLKDEVVYRGEYSDPEFGENPIWTRSLEEFQETVIVDEKSLQRFTLLES